jgi:acetylornithine deacetylase/succinyl-diaminopimelate desuccinylase-like protein
MRMLDQVLERAREGRSEAESDLFELISIPSVSALPEHREDCRRAASWLARKLHRMGMQVQVPDAPDGAQAVVMAEWMGRPGAPTLTIYGHYDVQPPDPLDEWESPPFEPTVRDGFVYGRGADDNKAQHMASVEAAGHWFADGGPPVNLRFLLEGEEEVGGRTLPDYVRTYADQLRTDYLLVADGSFVAPGMPSLLTGLRGLLYTEIEVVGPRVDLHSGIYGGVAPNPFNSLAHILAGLKDRDGHVQVPGFYDDVEPPSAEELEGWKTLPITDEQQRAEIGVPELDGEAGYSVLERKWTRPTLDPKKVLAGLREAVAGLATSGTRAEVVALADAPPVRMAADHPGVEAARKAFGAAFGAAPVLTREGGSIPVTIDFQQALGTRLLVTGFGLPGDALHSPNERMSLDQYHRATEMVIHLMQELAGDAGR